MEQEYNAEKWLHTAAKDIRFKPDRLLVEAELREHLEDKTADMARIFHIEGEKAEQEALKRMGDAEEIGRALVGLSMEGQPNFAEGNTTCVSAPSPAHWRGFSLLCC